jgi:Ser/Thr protein kinase RdoA (MazF antagonist)
MEQHVLLAQGREADVFLLAETTVLKLMRDASDEPRVRREAAALRVLAKRGYGVPTVLDVVTIDGRPGLVMQRIVGTDLLQSLGRRPQSVFRAGRVIGEAHVAMHDCVAPPELPDLHDNLRKSIQLAKLLPVHLRAVALEVLDGLPRGDRLCHGDLHFGNMLGSWSAPVIIDWGNASRGDPVADVARTEVILRFGDPPPDAPPLIRLLAPVCRKAVIGRYLATYQRQRPFEPKLLERWAIVQAAARLLEVIPSEHPRLIAFLEERRSSDS